LKRENEKNNQMIKIITTVLRRRFINGIVKFI